ncbi:MAG: ankyrin repeat domain-containing protein [Pseudomonadota bacterium]
MTLDLKALRKQGKTLKRNAQAGEADALARMAQATGRHDITPTHSAALLTLAREAGFASWPKLVFSAQMQGLTRADRAEALKRALFLGQGWRIDTLLGAEPDLASDTLGLLIATYQVDEVARRLSTAPELVHQPIGPRRPILHLTFSQFFKHAPDTRGDMMEMAKLLLRYGADVNDGVPHAPGAEHHLSALYGALGHAGNLPLAEWLLDKSADPNDNESLYHACELGHAAGLRLLGRYGVKTGGTNALSRILDFDDLEGLDVLLGLGADPDETYLSHPSGEYVARTPALHQAARRGRGAAHAQRLLAAGAQATRVWEGHTPYALARIYGNDAFADALKAAGHATPLSEVEEVLATCARGQIPPRRITVAEQTGNEKMDEVALLLCRLATQPGRAAHLEALVAAGLDPNRPEEQGMPPLHLAVWEGLAENTAYLVGLSPDFAHENDYGGNALGTCVHGAEHCPSKGRQHVACAAMLVAAGATCPRSYLDETGSEDMAAFLEDHPEALTDT